MWYNDFFSGIALDFWQASHEPQQTKEEVAFLQKVFQLPKNSALLDLFCGYGRHALPMARKGFVVTGIDIAASYISQLQQQATAHRLPINALHADVCNAPLSRTYAGAYCMGNSIAYLDRTQLHACLQHLSPYLQAGSYMVLHTGMLAECLLPNLVQRDWQTTPDGRAFLMENHYNAPLGRLETQLTFVQQPANTNEQRTIYHHVYTYADMSHIMAAHGWVLQKAYANTYGEPFELGDHELYLVAQKK